MRPVPPLLRLPLALLFLAPLAGAARAQNLEIHYINVGWGGCVLIKGPNGTTLLLEAGNTGHGTNHVVPYLQSIGIPPSAGLDYMILGHRHCDHAGGMDEVIQAGYDVHVANYDNGSTSTPSCWNDWVDEAETTSAGGPVPMPLGTIIDLGNGALLTCIARNGALLGGTSIPVSTENDRSIALLVQYGGFDYLWASDLGGGEEDNSCTGRSSSQDDLETPLIQTISPGGAAPLIAAGGIDVLHVNHHGAESSTNSNYMNLAQPTVAAISIGAGQESSYNRPRRDVVEKVLLSTVSCVTAPPALVLQSEEGNPSGSNTSFAGYCVGNFKFTTNGVSTFTVSADGLVTEGPDERVAAQLPRTFNLDNVAGPPPPPPPTDTTPPVLSNVLASNVLAKTATVSWTTNEPATSLLQYGKTTSYGKTKSDSDLETSHSFNLSSLSTDTTYHYRVRSTDAHGNEAVGTDHTFHTGTLETFTPSVVTVLAGTALSGAVAELASDDNVYFVVQSTAEGTRVTNWTGEIASPQAPASMAKLEVKYAGKYSLTVNQKMYLWNWATSAWTEISSKSVGTSEKSVTVTPLPFAPFVSASGHILLRVLGTGGTLDFTASTDRIRFTIETAGTTN
jgi:beta-lactamase superfamily II metal-dependent hydrolase